MKKIKDMTLEEVKNMCKGQEVCVGCVLANEQGSCKLGTDFYPGFPASFDLREPGEPRFSAQDIEDATTICSVFDCHPDAIIGRNKSGIPYLMLNGKKVYLLSTMLPGIPSGEEYTFCEVLGKQHFEKGGDV